MNGGQFLDSDDAVLIIKAFVLEELNVYKPCVADVEGWNPVLFARYEYQHLHLKTSYNNLAAKFRHWMDHGKGLPGHVIQRVMANLEGDEFFFKRSWFFARKILFGWSNPESNCSADEIDGGDWLLVHVPAPPAAPSDDGWEMLQLPAASDDDCS
jgi:hypothetical protein